MRGAGIPLPTLVATGSFLFTALPVVSGARVQDTVEESAPKRTEYLSLTHLDAYFEFKGEFSYHRVGTNRGRGYPRTVRQSNRDWSFREQVGLSFGAVVIDPRFITFGGELSFGLAQDRFEEHGDVRGQTDRDNGYLAQFDLRANLFPGRALSGSVYALSQEDRVNRAFQATLNQRRRGFGTSWVFAHDRIPMELSFDYQEIDRTGNADPRDDEHFTDTSLRYSARWLISDVQRLLFSYEHGDIKQEYQGLNESFRTQRDLFNIEHQLRLGDDGQHDLRTVIHWQEESGDFARDFFEIGPQLTLQHSDNLQSIYKYQYNRERYEGLDIDTHRADIQLVHQMYTNLTTTFDVFGLYEDIQGDVNTTQYGASVDFQYNRRNRFGHLYANLALAYDTEDVDGDGGTRLILDEAQTFRDPVAVTLRNRDAIPHTIVVTDTSNRVIFNVGTDYLIVQQGNVIQLTRVRSGRIANGDTVLIDYQIRTPQRGQLDTIRVDVSVEQRFTNGVTPYYRLSYRNQEDDVSTGFARRADRTDHHRMGVRYDGARYALGAEVEIFDDTIDPYDAFHVDGLMHVYKQADHTVDTAARLSRYYFEGGVDDRDVTAIDVEFDHRWRLTDALYTLERAVYRYENDSAAGITHAWDIRTGLEYVVGDLSGELTLEYDRLDLPDSTEDNFGVYLQLRREVSNVLSRR